MATLSKHGKEIGRIEYLTKTKAYFDSRDILINRGFGWKEYGKVKATKTAMEAYTNAKNRLDWKLHAAILSMPEDPDGVWSECCDGYGDNLHASIDEIVDICKLYALIENELAIENQ